VSHHPRHIDRRPTPGHARQSLTLLNELDGATDTPEQYAALIASAKAGHLDENGELDYERHRASLAGRGFTLSFEHGFHVIGEFDALRRRLLTQSRFTH
jgi:hypothetical protein